jgi:hypothetical protein
MTTRLDLVGPRGRVARWVATVYVGFAVALIPWVIYLALVLPRRNLNEHYDLTWVGFDCLLVAALARTGYLALKRRPLIAVSAAATATLLVVDVWFDVMTAEGAQARGEAVVIAVLVELPLAAVSAAIARRASRAIAEAAPGTGVGREDTGVPGDGWTSA